MGVQGQQQGNTSGTMSLGANLCQVGNCQPEGPHSKCCLWSLLPHHLSLLSHLAGLSQAALPASSTSCMRAGSRASLPHAEGLSPSLVAGCRGPRSALLPASSAALSSPCKPPHSVANCRAMAAQYQSYLLTSSLTWHFGKNCEVREINKTSSVNPKFAHAEWECYCIF